MTPRKVKRQSQHRSSRRSNRHRSSQRQSQRHRRPAYVNPVTQLLDKANDSSTSTDSFRPRPPPLTFGGRQGHSNPTYVHSRPTSTFSVNSDPPERPPSVHSSYSNYHGQRPSLNPNGTTSFGGPRRSLFATGPNSSASTLRSFSNDAFSDGERPPPPYMFGVSSETVI